MSLRFIELMSALKKIVVKVEEILGLKIFLFIRIFSAAAYE